MQNIAVDFSFVTKLDLRQRKVFEKLVRKELDSLVKHAFQAIPELENDCTKVQLNVLLS